MVIYSKEFRLISSIWLTFLGYSNKVTRNLKGVSDVQNLPDYHKEPTLVVWFPYQDASCLEPGLVYLKDLPLKGECSSLNKSTRMAFSSFRLPEHMTAQSTGPIGIRPLVSNRSTNGGIIDIKSSKHDCLSSWPRYSNILHQTPFVSSGYNLTANWTLVIWHHLPSWHTINHLETIWTLVFWHGIKGPPLSWH